MIMSVIWIAMMLCALLYSLWAGTTANLGAAITQGTSQAVTFCLSTGALICLWSGLMEVLSRSGAMSALSRLLRRPLTILFPDAAKDKDTIEALSANVSANLLGLGNAATPMGIRAAEGLSRLANNNPSASESLCMLVVVNTASVQLLPTTIASVRAQFGASEPFDILPAVWISSIASVVAGVLMGKFLSATLFKNTC